MNLAVRSSVDKANFILFRTGFVALSLVYRWIYAKNSSNCAKTVVNVARGKGVKRAFFVQREHLSSRQFSLSGRLSKTTLKLVKTIFLLPPPKKKIPSTE